MKKTSIILWTSIGLLTATAVYYLMQNKSVPAKIAEPDLNKPAPDSKSPIRKYMHKAKIAAEK